MKPAALDMLAPTHQVELTSRYCCDKGHFATWSTGDELACACCRTGFLGQKRGNLGRSMALFWTKEHRKWENWVSYRCLCRRQEDKEGSCWGGCWSTESREQWWCGIILIGAVCVLIFAHPWWQGVSFCLTLSLFQGDHVWCEHPVKLCNLKVGVVGVARTGMDHRGHLSASWCLYTKKVANFMKEKL